MNIKNTKLYLLLVIFISLLLIISCAKNNPITSEKNKETTVQNTTIETKSTVNESSASSETNASNPNQSTNTSTSETQTTSNNPQTIDFSNETVGAVPTSFLPAVGNWVIGIDGNNKVLVVDGSKWKSGEASSSLAEQARKLYGDKYGEFLDNVTAYAYFPFAVASNIEDFSNGEISLKFKTISGQIDQAAGILIDLKPNGDYFTLRANAIEQNMVFWKFASGKRSSEVWVRNVPTSKGEWHNLKVVVNGKSIQGYLDDKLYLESQLPSTVSGKVGIWSKSDSVVYFNDFSVKFNNSVK
ncbi:MAG: LamG domain-containing protein [Candidatus Humimicrobiaceae bacterium]